MSIRKYTKSEGNVKAVEDDQVQKIANKIDEGESVDEAIRETEDERRQSDESGNSG